MELLSTADTEKRDQKLTRDDWILAAIEALLSGGIEAVRILKLSNRLEVTRGSFYWHFDSHDDLLNAILAEWRARNTGVMIDVLRNAKELEDGILNLFSVWVDHSQFNPHLDQAVRDWARRSPDVHDVVSQEDDNRVHEIATFFERQDYPETEAFIRARVIYFTQISYFALGVKEPMEQRFEYLAAYFRTFTGREITPSVAKAYAARYFQDTSE